MFTAARLAYSQGLERAGLPRIRFHDLRHTCATLLLGKGVHPKLVQELLGHATIAIALDTYSHVLPGMGDTTASAMEETFSSPAPVPTATHCCRRDSNPGTGHFVLCLFPAVSQ